jgi:hypothetical protein
MHLLADPQLCRLGALVLVGLSAAACGSSATDQAADTSIAAAVAQHLDPLNGLPSVVVDGYYCRVTVEECVPGAAGPFLSPLDATEFAGAFAAARGLPLVSFHGSHSPACPWSDNEAGDKGLSAMFAGPPSVDADSAAVELITGCTESGVSPFVQVHRFVLRRARDGWVVVRRELTGIT